MKRGAYIFVLVLFLIGAGPAMAAKPPPVCGDGKCRGDEPTTCPADCDGGGGGAVSINVCVTLANFAAVDIPAKFRGDVAGDVTYCDSETGISAVINSHGHFGLSINPKKTNRELRLDLPAGFCPGSTVECTITNSNGMSTGNLDEYFETEPGSGVFLISGELDLHALPIGEENVFGGLRIGFPSDSFKGQHLVFFGANGPDDCLAQGGTPVRVFRADSTTWIFTAVSPTDQACLLEVLGRNDRQLKDGNFSLPLRMTLVAE